MNTLKYLLICTILAICAGISAGNDKPDWNLSGSKIKNIRFNKPYKAADLQDFKPKTNKKAFKNSKIKRSNPKLAAMPDTIFAWNITAPPVNGFVPWIAVSVTDARSNPDDYDFVASPTTTIEGDFLTANPKSDYVIGIFDTGASSTVLGFEPATKAGIFDAIPSLVTSNTATVFGVSGSVEALVSQPLAVYADGINAIEPNGFLIDRSNMVGEKNLSILLGQGEPGLPDLPVAIGTPFSVYYAAEIKNDQRVTVTHDSNTYTGPSINLYEKNSPAIPTMQNTIVLELRPLGSVNASYIIYPDPLNPFETTPASPSILTGTSPTQSIFFVSSVDLYNTGHTAIDKTRFMFDTGAQVTVVGSRVAARLALNPNNPDFEVDIQGVTGDIIVAPGFFIDSLQIPALGDWLIADNVPVILLDVPSPEGGTVDGIIGMNLFTSFNLVFHGGGLYLEEDPKVQFEPLTCNLTGDIAPGTGDCFVNELDLQKLSSCWLLNTNSGGWDETCDIYPDGQIDFLDFASLAKNWYK